MQLYVRPTPPQGFPSEKWKTTREAAERIIEAQIEKLKRKEIASRKGRSSKKGGSKKKIFPEIWKDYKALFAYAQFGKCGFCETLILSIDYGDVEHYRPKSAISSLSDDPALQGRQQEASASILKRAPYSISSTGYYWLAYDWSNYLLACSMCNGLKSTIFPVKDDPRAVNPLKTEPLEHALLLNPYEKKLPARHLRFQRDGFVLAKSAYGHATIETCGLYREQLRAARAERASKATDWAQDLKRPPNKRQNSELLKNCYEYGADDAPYCGMVRSIFEEAGISWESIVRQRAKELASESKRTRNAEKKKQNDESLEKMGRARYGHSAAVREIFEKTCNVTWDELISRHAYQLARDFLACRKDWEKDARYKLNWKKKFYDLARDNLNQLAVVRATFEKQCRMDWNELKAEVEAGFQFIWNLPTDDAN